VDESAKLPINGSDWNKHPVTPSPRYSVQIQRTVRKIDQNQNINQKIQNTKNTKYKNTKYKIQKIQNTIYDLNNTLLMMDAQSEQTTE